MTKRATSKLHNKCTK